MKYKSRFENRTDFKKLNRMKIDYHNHYENEQSFLFGNVLPYETTDFYKNESMLILKVDNSNYWNVNHIFKFIGNIIGDGSTIEKSLVEQRMLLFQRRIV
jgi:hypothetical protein